MTDIEILGSAPRVSVKKLRPNPSNDNKESSFQFGKLIETIKKDGFAQPITVRSGDTKGKFRDGLYEIIGGEHRWKAALELGMLEVPVHDLGCISDLKAKKILLGLNKLHGESDMDKLSALLRDIASEGVEELANLPFDEDTLKDLLDNEVDLKGVEGLSDDPDGMGSDSIELSDVGGKASARDLLVILDVQGIKGKECARLLDAVRQWSFGREDQSVKPWEDLINLLVENTTQR
jgi:ParB-like chromosome segregation protein Spo0J